MGRTRFHKAWIMVAAAVLVVVLAGLIGLLGRPSIDAESTTNTAADRETAVAGGEESSFLRKGIPPTEVAPSAPAADGSAMETIAALTSLTGLSGQKLISDAQVQIEIKPGGFDNAFAQALLIADRYGGYIVSSTSHAGSVGDEGMRSGVIAIRVPSMSFDNALADAAKLGEVKNREIRTQDVTAEYVDLEARITNARAHVRAVLALMARATTVEETLQVQQVLTVAQEHLEQLEGRKRYLDEHTSFSTLTLSMYETGVAMTAVTDWGVVKALEDALHNLVGAFNAIIRGLGVLIPVLVVLAIVAYAAYRVWKSAVRRRRERYTVQHPPHLQGWPAQQPPPAPDRPLGPDAGAGPQA